MSSNESLVNPSSPQIMWQTFAGVLLAVITWILTLLLVSLVSLAFEFFRHGNIDDPLTLYGSSLIAAGAAGYASIFINDLWLSKANLKVVFWSFSAFILGYTTLLPLLVVTVAPDAYSLVWTEQVFQSIQGVVSIFFAYYGLRKIETRRENLNKLFRPE
jgi:hypothetical protein